MAINETPVPSQFTMTAIENFDFERVHNFQYLGIQMDPTLSWKEHTNTLGKKKFKKKLN